MHEAGPGEKRIARASRTECETLYTMLERGIIKTIRNCVSGQHKMRNTISIPTESDEAAFAYLPTDEAVTAAKQVLEAVADGKEVKDELRDEKGEEV